jgi:uncharacterized protein (DUF1697 family)
MTAFVGLLRGINVGGRNTLRMSDLRSLCESLGLDDVQTHLQSGNVVFHARTVSAKAIEAAIRKSAGIDVRVILRTAAELERIIAANPFDATRDPSRLLVMFFEAAPAEEGKAALLKAHGGPEEIRFAGRELYIDYPINIGRSKLTGALIEKKLCMAGTARNWNTVSRLLEMAKGV